jgi:hypothetical protein
MAPRSLLGFFLVYLAVASTVMAQTTPGTVVGSPARGGHSREYWKQIAAKDFAAPDGETAATLVPELVAMLGSPDPDLREEVAYSTLATWAYRDGALTPNELKALAFTLRDNLALGIGEQGTDSVLLRSYSALTLTVLVARDARVPFLDAGELGTLLDAVARYAPAERDLRGYVPDKGWHHAGAHTADLLRSLARHPRVDNAGLIRVLSAVADLVDNAGGVAFVHGEEERLARAAVTALRRDLVPIGEVRVFLDRITRAERQVWQAYRVTNRLDQVTFAGSRNGRGLMLNMLFLMGLDDKPTDAYTHATSAVRAALLSLEPK